MTDDHKRKIRVAREATNRDMETHAKRKGLAADAA